MEVLTVLRALLAVVLLLGSAERSECVRCFARFNLGQCDEELGEVDDEDCCQNPHYGYQATDGVCQSCGPPVWSPWSPWSRCNVLCGDGVTQKRRTCFGIGQCDDPANNLQTKPCIGSCCDAKGWGLWLPWSPCSVTCGGGGVRKRVRVCSSGPQCQLACIGPTEETETCPTHDNCPVHGLWSTWSCWGECSASCIPQGQTPVRTRHRSCSNPAPSSSPPGRDCHGDDRQTEDCSFLHHCAVDGSWGSWSPFSSCPVTCGLGLEVSTRKCDSPTPKHGGQLCLGDERRTRICDTRVHCPVDGMWSEWSSWSECKYQFSDRSINCERISGIQKQERQCLHRAHNGSYCSGSGQTRRRLCYDVHMCDLKKGSWQDWEPWGLCEPACGENSKRERVRYCEPDYSGYRHTVGPKQERPVFFGTPEVKCDPLPEGEQESETQPCVNVPACQQEDAHQ